MKIVFGRNSAISKIMAVEMIVLRISTAISDPINGISKGLRSLEKNNPYITRAMLLPISIVAMYWPGLRAKILIISDPKAPCFLSNSILSLFEVTKAISIPEKNAERIIAIIMIRIESILIFFLPLSMPVPCKKKRDYAHEQEDQDTAAISFSQV